MSREELADIRVTGRFRAVEGMMEGKWFAETHEGALLHADSPYPGGDCIIVAGDVSKEVFDRAYCDVNLDRFGPARYFEEVSGLALIVPVLEWEADDP